VTVRQARQLGRDALVPPRLLAVLWRDQELFWRRWQQQQQQEAVAVEEVEEQYQRSLRHCCSPQL
jgi:hypothetical protein